MTHYAFQVPATATEYSNMKNRSNFIDMYKVMFKLCGSRNIKFELGMKKNFYFYTVPHFFRATELSLQDIIDGIHGVSASSCDSYIELKKDKGLVVKVPVHALDDPGSEPKSSNKVPVLASQIRSTDFETQVQQMNDSNKDYLPLATRILECLWSTQECNCFGMHCYFTTGTEGDVHLVTKFGKDCNLVEIYRIQDLIATNLKDIKVSCRDLRVRFVFAPLKQRSVSVRKTYPKSVPAKARSQQPSGAVSSRFMTFLSAAASIVTGSGTRGRRYDNTGDQVNKRRRTSKSK